MKQKFWQYKSRYPLIFNLIVLFSYISGIAIFAAVLSGPNSPTANSVSTYLNNKQLTNTGVIIDGNSNVSGVNGFTGQVMHLQNVRATNFYIGSNSLASWPTTPEFYGDAYWGNSNGVIYLLTSTNITSLIWTKTNLIAP